ncbi:uncharacterized protein BYT42DRAFT_169806 [Radiomyces spectabilis]|uniref:uncharacterized protein n=1 Tax=Radiomyces spectabilis TaxID=64574 RepID=UPI002220704E|nr:uncharacterized protein BYT42DRAFT_169806 [Radiomyces spectabilis]KAI8364786.1 hypothetical protein BYT42DRAFT_169806 [Radiomyces spectabilis]
MLIGTVFLICSLNLCLLFLGWAWGCIVLYLDDLNILLLSCLFTFFLCTFTFFSFCLHLFLFLCVYRLYPTFCSVYPFFPFPILLLFIWLFMWFFISFIYCYLISCIHCHFPIL